DHINNFNDMKGKVLGVQNGSTGMTDLDEYPKLLKDKIKGKSPILYDTFPNAFIDLNANRIQGILMDEVYANYYIQHQANAKSYSTYISNKMGADYFAVGMRKGDKTLKKKVNEGLKRLQEDGQLKKINEKWFGKASNFLGPVNYKIK
ncbi:MAG: transporter substrate-binding domain-containing protein, partial [Limosilactobacillus fermentum]